jgi:hypothetical protein
VLYVFVSHGSSNDIINRDAPRFGDLKLDLEEQILVDTATRDRGLGIAYIKDLNLDNSENFIILTYDKIMKFSAAGQLINTLKLDLGQGPGEFADRPSRFFVDSYNNFYIYDGYKLVSFDKDFIFVKNIHLALLPGSELYIDNNGFLYTLKSVFEEARSYTILGKFSGDGRLVKTISSFPDLSLKSTRGISLFISHPYAVKPLYCLTAGDRIVVAYSSEYKLFSYDLNGILQSKFAVMAKHQKIGLEEKDLIRRNLGKTKLTGLNISRDIKFPENRPFMKSIISDEKGRIYVVRVKSILNKDREELIDIFSADGKYIYQVKLPVNPKYIRRGNIFNFWEEIDEQGNVRHRISRIVIKNYHSLRERAN